MLNVIHSGLMGELGKYYRISVMSDLMAAEDIDRFNRHFRLDMHWLPTPVPAISMLVKWLRAVQTLLFGHYFGLGTIRIKLLERGRLFHWLFCISRKSPALSFLSGWLMVLIRNWLIRRTTRPNLYASLRDHHFQAVVSTSPFDLRENAVANSFKPHGIPCISIIVSWDNLTSKGIINSESGKILVWNKTMALEYQRFHAIFGENALVRIAGIPRFDRYFREPPGLRSADLSEMNPKTQTILFSTGAVKHHSCQNYIIRDLLAYAESRTDITIFVRCHPCDDPRRYECFRGIRNLSFFQPFSEKTGQVPPADFLETLHYQLAACDVCVQVASTMLLDAAACGKPCISIAYDADPGVHYAGSVRRFYDYSHQLPLQKCLKEHIVYNRVELFAKLDEALAGTSTPTDLINTINPIIDRLTPDSVFLTTKYIREWLD
ncbi:hypothetical protein SAMN05216327_110115 [Dyadobacter sp. SG02]|nr:hypothetical protein SAMN05216327_110115 [Dyadobacter sp. SG02]